MWKKKKLVRVGIALWAAALPLVGTTRESPKAGPPVAGDRPFLAIWRDHDGHRDNPGAPYLRAAFWDDGRVVFASDSENWNHDLLRGKIADYRVARLKKAVTGTGVFDLRGNCYLSPDLPTDCIMVNLGDKKQMLYWTEGETSWMESKAHRMEFVRCWRAVSDLAVVACPDVVQTEQQRFGSPPKSWYLKRPIQSE